MMGWYAHGMGPGAWLFMGGFWLALLALAVLLVVRLVPAGARDSGRPEPESPEDVLDRRFARGEIDEQTYAAGRAAVAAHRGPVR
jgi:putative membrane protein